MQNLMDWLDGNQDLISTLSSMAAVVSMLIAAAGLLFTGYQLRRAANQSKAQAIYDIQKDGRQMAAALIGADDLFTHITGAELTLDLRAGAAIGQMFNFYAAVRQQLRLGVIDERIWAPFEVELRFMLSSSAVARRFWVGKREAAQYDADFVAVVNSILAGISADPGADS